MEAKDDLGKQLYCASDGIVSYIILILTISIVTSFLSWCPDCHSYN